MSDVIMRAKLQRPVEDYLTGYEGANNKWVPGLLEVVQKLQTYQTMAVYITLIIVLAQFVGVHSLSDIIKLVKSF